MINFPLHQLLQFLVQENGDEAVVKTVHQAIDRRRVTDGKACQRREYLRITHQGPAFNRAIAKGKVRDVEALAGVLQALHIRFEELCGFQESRAPWDLWEAGKKVVILFGGKLARLPDSEILNQVVGSQDARSLRVLERVLRDHAGIQYVAETIHVSPTMTAAEAEADFAKLLKTKDVGAIIVLGSEIVNPFAAHVAREIFDGMNPRDMPIHYRWPHSYDVEKPFFASKKVCEPENEGIALSYDEDRTSLPRVGDQAVIEAIRKGKKGPFSDCGILAVSSFGDKILILCAGHGGCGTTAAVHGLGRVDYVQARLQESAQSTSDERYLPPCTILEPLWVERTKKTLEYIDDFSFDETYGKGWQFYFDEEEGDVGPALSKAI